MLYRIKRVFDAHLNFEAGQIRELTDVEARRYVHLIEPIAEESGSYTDTKPNKKYKKGRNK